MHTLCAVKAVDMGSRAEEFSWLACQAAIELDNMLLGRPTDASAVGRLGQKLGQSVAGDATSASVPRLADMRRTLALHAAVRRIGSVDQSTVSGLQEVTRALAQQLCSVGSQSLHDDLVKLRSFCVALSRAAVVSERPVLERPRRSDREML